MKYFASIKLTVFCLLWLAVLTVWGTIFQVDNGIYQAQHRFFDSIVFFAYGYIPLPGGMLTLGLLFANLIGSFFVHYQAGWRMPGLMLTHLGLLLLLLGGLFTRITGIEGQMSLLPGEGSNLAESLTEWELMISDELSNVRDVHAIDFRRLREGTRFRLDDSGLRFRVIEAHANARAFGGEGEPQAGLANASGIRSLRPVRLDKEPPMNRPGLILQVEGAQEITRALLWGGEANHLALQLPEGGVRFLRLRRRQHELPLFLELNDFQKSFYPNSQIPSDYRSLVTVRFGEDHERNAIIKMNEPLRHQGWTFYQASFSQDPNSGMEFTVLAVTRNYGRLIPYWGTGMASLGLAMHFVQVQWMQSRRRRRKAA